MDIEQFLNEITVIPGIPGYEGKVAETVIKWISPWVDDTSISPLYSATGRINGTGPKVLIAAHADEVGLMVNKIDDDGALRVVSVGGVDGRILPASIVTVHASASALTGVIGAKPPHLMTADDREKATKVADVYVDLGMSVERVKALVEVGDMVTLIGEPLKLSGDYMTSKTMDDRACIAAMIVAAEELKRLKHGADVTFVATAQEEITGAGAATAGYTHRPDVAIVLDVTHAKVPDSPKHHSADIDKIHITRGPQISEPLRTQLVKSAGAIRVEYCEGVSAGHTGTDVEELQIASGGIPCVLIEVPLRYMHTTVETLSLNVIRETGRLIARFVADLSASWEDIIWN